jgi:hypothetical protein
MSSLYCPKCGKEHITADRYCQYCGADLENVILKFKQKNLPVRFNGEFQDEEKMKRIEKEISDYSKTEMELEEFDILPENLGNQKISDTYTQSVQSIHRSSFGHSPEKQQRVKLKRKEDPWWENLLWCC